MSMLAERVDGVIGVDTHRDTLAAVAVTHLGGVLAQTSVNADAAGYQRLLDFARAHLPGRRCWAIEGAGSFGAGIALFAAQRGEQVVEVGRPSGQPRGPGPRVTRWTRSGPLGKRLARTVWRSGGSVASAKPCGSC